MECLNASENKYDNIVIDILSKQLDFMQKELQSKDEIIKMLLDERTRPEYSKSSNSNINVQNDKKDVPAKRLNKIVENKTLHYNEIPDVKQAESKSKVDEGFNTVTTKTKKRNSNRRTVSVFGDSMIKDLNAYEMTKELKNKNERVYNHVYRGATTSDMHHHGVPVMRHNPDCVILHTGTNSLRGPDSPQKQAEDIIDLATSLKTNENEIMISSILPRRDRLHEKGQKVNDFLRTKCIELGIPFILNSNITTSHLKPKGLHLNTEGSDLLSENFINFVNM